MKRYLLLFIFIMSIFKISNGQTKDSLYFQGIVMDNDSLLGLPFAKYVINYDQLFTTNKNGEFSMWVKKGDVVTFSHVGFKTISLHVEDSLVQENFIMGVFLSRDTIQLSEIVILPQINNAKERLQRMPIVQDKDAETANKNISDAPKMATTTMDEDWDADKIQRYSLNAKSDAVKYNRQIGPDQAIELSNIKIKELIDRRRYKRK